MNTDYGVDINDILKSISNFALDYFDEEDMEFLTKEEPDDDDFTE